MSEITNDPTTKLADRQEEVEILTEWSNENLRPEDLEALGQLASESQEKAGSVIEKSAAKAMKDALERAEEEEREIHNDDWQKNPEAHPSDGPEPTDEEEE